jgi:regulation of enolase protein 1 (concanavalin A-like superfamily)
MPTIKGKEFKWMTAPQSWSEEEGVFRLKTDPKTDFWRKTHYGFISENGHFLYTSQQGDFELSLKFSGKYTDLYDQAGLMIFLDNENWIKAGVEYVEGIQNASAVVTRDCSDWSVAPLEGMPESFFIKARRGRDYVEISYSLDGQDFRLLRQAYFPPSPSLQIGLMAASPKGSGFEVTFDSLDIETINGQ